MFKILIISLLLSFTATSQTVKKPTLTQRVSSLEKFNVKSRSADVYRLYFIMQIKFDSVMKELAVIKAVQKRATEKKYDAVVLEYDTVIMKKTIK